MSQTERELHSLRERCRELDAARKLLLKELNDKDRQIDALCAMSKRCQPITFKTKSGRGYVKRVACPVILCSDWHVEEPVSPNSVNGLNEYNLEIADRCIRDISEAYVWLANDKRFDVRHGLLWLGGDLFSGYIHEELVEHNFLSPVEAVVWLLERLVRMIRDILRNLHIERLLVICNDGNHGRLTNKIRVSTRTANSLEWLMYKVLASRFEDEPRVQFDIADGEYSYADVYGCNLCFFHGDSVKYGGGVGGLTVPMNRGLNELRKYRKVDVFNFGHFHQRIDLPQMTGNGSMIGLNAYAMRNKFAPEPRQQTFYMVDSERGKCLSAPVWL